MSKSLRGYLADIKRIYQESSGKIEEKYNELQKLDGEIKRIQSSRDYSFEGRQKKYREIDAKRSVLKDEMSALRDEANNNARMIRDEVERTFYGFFNANPDSVDLKLMELIRSGVLTERELIHYGQSANTTMRRVIGKELEKRSGSPEAHQASVFFQSTSGDPHLKAVDELISIGQYVVGGAPLGGLDSVPHIRKKFDEIADPVIYGIRDVSPYTNDDGSVSYTVSE